MFHMTSGDDVEVSVKGFSLDDEGGLNDRACCFAVG